MIKYKSTVTDKLSEMPSRPLNTKETDQIFDIFKTAIDHDDVNFEEMSFNSPIHYMQILSWLFGLLILALFISSNYPFSGLALIGVLTFFGFLYFDWRISPLTLLPPLIKCKNFIACRKNENVKAKLVLMAHWDTAPITFPYRQNLVSGLKKSVYIGFALIILTFILNLAFSLGYLTPFQTSIRVVLATYFAVQLIVIYFDFFRFGYSNGANDNATGCTAAIEVANYLWSKDQSIFDIEICITGAEEVGMLGARQYLINHQKEGDKPMLLINFDTIGCDRLQIITQSGTFSNINYNNALVDLAKEVALEDNFPINFSQYNTADVDTVWFARSGIPCFTIISHDNQGIPSNIHRPEDTKSNINWNSVEQAIFFAKKVCDRMISDELNIPLITSKIVWKTV